MFIDIFFHVEDLVQHFAFELVESNPKVAVLRYEHNHGAGHAHLESLLIELGLARGFLGGERIFGFILSNLTRCKVSVVLGGKQ
ncbi:hypothetical protein P8452_50796 [Trifolium repens]|nr:hypothetical protein P8452_50796 [Trifolium repens]